MAGGRTEGSVTREMIERRAFELSLVQAPTAPEEHWLQAEQELLEEAQQYRNDLTKQTNGSEHDG